MELAGHESRLALAIWHARSLHVRPEEITPSRRKPPPRVVTVRAMDPPRPDADAGDAVFSLEQYLSGHVLRAALVVLEDALTPFVWRLMQGAFPEVADDAYLAAFHAQRAEMAARRTAAVADATEAVPACESAKSALEAAGAAKGAVLRAAKALIKRARN